ncbi:hypothetical protein Aca07nite_08130 [Actinoplanes capillaceus]|uniref:Uncharacterized protein n=1 Tax=Actinoplanes campanulatus TaxID=113559 RepID=A0ABQ3WBI6_9ACTN|nr:hypothetical protein GCM10010109_29160 [Actinoplanes campanulatus]GID37560.1 hypothetical protein Aca09nite_40660 [Actinoplanes campanulatus]GID43538.1 hypothetical protein Aca07nite_08130 [Actinoplanes capillaceus]
MIRLTLFQQPDLVLVGLRDELSFGALLLDIPVLAEVHAAGETRDEKTDGRSTNSEPAPEPLHEDSLRRGQ